MRADSSPLRIAILTSHGAPGLEQLISDPRHGTLFEVAAVLSCGASVRTSVPVIPMPRPPRSRERDRHDAGLARILKELNPDFILLIDYRYVLTGAVLEPFAGRMIAMHDGDRQYRGLHAVSNALFAGEQETRSSAFIVTERVDEGPLVLLSGGYRVAPIAEDARRWGRADLLTSYAELHRDWMVESSWGPMLVRTVEMLAAGTMQVIGNVVWVDGVPGPCRMGEAPAVCHEEIAAGIPRWCPYIAT